MKFRIVILTIGLFSAVLLSLLLVSQWGGGTRRTEGPDGPGAVGDTDPVTEAPGRLGAVGGDRGSSPRQELGPEGPRRARSRLLRNGRGVPGCQFRLFDRTGKVLHEGATDDEGWFELTDLSMSGSGGVQAAQLEFMLYENLTLEYPIAAVEPGGQQYVAPPLKEVDVAVNGFRQSEDWSIGVQPIKAWPTSDINVVREARIAFRMGGSAGFVHVQTVQLHGRGGAQKRLGVHRRGGIVVDFDARGYLVDPDRYSCGGGERISFSPKSKLRFLNVDIVAQKGGPTLPVKGRVWVMDLTEKWGSHLWTDLEKGHAEWVRSWTARQGYDPSHEYELSILLEDGQVLRDKGIPNLTAPRDRWEFVAQVPPAAVRIDLGGVQIAQWLQVDGKDVRSRLWEWSLDDVSPPESPIGLLRKGPNTLVAIFYPGLRKILAISKAGRLGSLLPGARRIDWAPSAKLEFDLAGAIAGASSRVKFAEFFVRLPGSNKEWLFRQIFNAQAFPERGSDPRPAPKTVVLEKSRGAVYRLKLRAEFRVQNRVLLDLIL